MSRGAEEMLARAYELDEVDRVDDALDVVFDWVDDALEAGRLHEVDSLLRLADVSRMSVSLMLSLLASTISVGRRLPSRDDYYMRAHSHLLARGEPADRLLRRLL